MIKTILFCDMLLPFLPLNLQCDMLMFAASLGSSCLLQVCKGLLQMENIVRQHMP